jgi:hypothetical protein
LAPGQKSTHPPSLPPPPLSYDLTPLSLSCSTDDEINFPLSVCAPPSDPSPKSSPSPPLPHPPSLGDPSRHPQVELCAIHRSEEIIVEERALELMLIAVVGDTRPSVTIAEVWRWLTTCFDILGDIVTIQRYHSEDFLITFSYTGDML